MNMRNIKMNEKSSFETGKIYTMYVQFRDNDGNFIEPKKGKIRSAVIYKDPKDDTIFACQMTSKINKPLYKKWRTHTRYSNSWHKKTIYYSIRIS